MAEHLIVMREELVEMEEPEMWNDFIRKVRKRVLEGDWKDKREVWWRIRANRLGLVDKNLSERSKVDEEEARAFFTRQTVT